MKTAIVGSNVWFRRYVPGQGNSPPLAAIVSKVGDDGKLNLLVIDEGGGRHGEPGVVLVQEGEDCPDTASYCTWPAEAKEVKAAPKHEEPVHPMQAHAPAHPKDEDAHKKETHKEMHHKK